MRNCRHFLQVLEKCVDTIKPEFLDTYHVLHHLEFCKMQEKGDLPQPT